MVVVEDIERSGLWRKYAPIALSHGLRACWSVPIIDDASALLGTLALYYRSGWRRRRRSSVSFSSPLPSLHSFIQRHRDKEMEATLRKRRPL